MFGLNRQSNFGWDNRFTMLGDAIGKDLNTFVPDYVIFDLETTGMNPLLGDRIVEISAIKVIDHKVVEEFSTLVNPGRNIPDRVIAVHGITNEMVEDAPNGREALSAFLDFVGDSILVGHNIKYFDLNFLKVECSLFFDQKVPTNDYVDTLILAKHCMPEMAHRNLTGLATHFGLSDEGAHRALADCRMNQKVYECLKEETEKYDSGQKTVPKCEKCGKKMVIRKGKYGEFWGCSGYPSCKNTINIL